MAGHRFSPTDICAVQINRLDCDGTLLTGPTDVATLYGNAVEFFELSDTFDPEVDLSTSCTTYVREKQYQYTDVTVGMCDKIDTEINFDLLGLANPVLADTGAFAGDIVGGEAPTPNSDCPCNTCGPTCTNPGVAMIIWTLRLGCDGCEGHAAFVIPRIRFGYVEQARRIDRDTLTTYSIEGRAESNPNYGQGPGNIYPVSAGLQTAHAGPIVTDLAPQVACDCATAPVGYDSGALAYA